MWFLIAAVMGLWRIINKNGQLRWAVPFVGTAVRPHRGTTVNNAGVMHIPGTAPFLGWAAPSGVCRAVCCDARPCVISGNSIHGTIRLSSGIRRMNPTKTREIPNTINAKRGTPKTAPYVY